MGGDFPRDDCGQELFRWPCAPGRPGKHPPVRLRLSLCHLCAAFPRQSACFGNRPGQARIPRAGSRPVFAWQPRQRRPAWPGPRAAKAGRPRIAPALPASASKGSKDRIRNREPVRLRLALHQESRGCCQNGQAPRAQGALYPCAEWTGPETVP